MLLQLEPAFYFACPIYNSRNFICSYSGHKTENCDYYIYNSRNFICSYSICGQRY